MAITLLEGVVDAVKNYISTNMAAKILDLRTRYSVDASGLPDIKAYYTGELPITIPGFPSIVIRGSGFNPKIIRNANMEITYRLDVIIFMANDDVEARFKQLCRYTVGLVELCRSSQTALYQIRLGGTVELTESIKTPEYLQAMIIPILVDSAESF